MADFESDYQEFAGWKDAGRHVPAIKSLIGLINKYKLLGFGTGILMDAYDEIITGGIHQQFFPSPYFICFQECISVLPKMFVDRPEKDAEVAFFFDQHDQFAPHALALYNSTTDSPFFRARTKIKGLTFADRRQVMGLQAADILAYEIFKRLDHFHFDKLRPERKSLSALKDRLMSVTYWDRQRLAAAVADTEKAVQIIREHQERGLPGQPDLERLFPDEV